MDHKNHNTESRKNKHLNLKERMTIELRLKDGFSAYKIAKELKSPINTILNEIRRGTTTQIKKSKYVKMYLADTGEAIYRSNRKNSCRTFKRLECSDFINYAIDKIKNNSWSPDACVGNALAKGKFQRSQIVCTKTLYNYIDLGLLDVILTILERKTRNAIIHKITSKTAEAVTEALNSIRNIYGDKFSDVFKTITSDNSSEFANLSTLETETDTKVYFTHPYSSFEKGTNERHNGLIRRFIPKGKCISDYSSDDIAFIEEWMNTLPRRILNYKTLEELFEIHLDELYASQVNSSVLSHK